MESDILITAILIGFGFGNIFLCMFVAMGTSVGRGWKVGVAFIAGRFIGVIALGIFIALFGWYMDLDSSVMILIFAIMSLLFGALVLLWPRGLARLRLLRHCEVDGCENCEGSNDSQHDSQTHNKTHDCNSCSSSKNCAAKSLETQSQDTKERKRLHGRFEKYKGLSLASITVFGFVRGATPCLKILLLVPLILTLPLYESLVVTGLFAISSSVYSIIGIFMGSLLGMAISEKRIPHLRKAGAIMLIGIGIYYSYKFWTFSCPGGI